jgi:hypothetical protein
MIPASEGSPPQPSAKALALVRRGKKDDDASVKNYLKEVHSLLETDLSGQALLSGVQGGDSRALEKAHADLGESRTKLQEMEVPPRCVSLHGYYLTLMDEIEQFFVIQKRAQGGEMEGILEGLVTAQKVIAMHKQVEKMEKELLKPQK